MSAAQSPPKNPRIASLDQFRGYTVAGMILVNYIGGFDAIDAALRQAGLGAIEGVFEHHNTYFSYADSIMPAFHFAVGFALRMTLLRRLATVGTGRAYFRVVRRCLGLILLSTVLELATADKFKSWAAIQSTNWSEWLADFFKCGFWETLAIIGVTSIWVLPVIANRASVRVLFIIGSVALHVILSYLFYFDYLWAKPNWLDAWWGAVNTKGLDGGPLGCLMWGVSQLIGSLAYDAVTRSRPWPAVFRLLAWSAVLMVLGYGLSCMTTLYTIMDPPPPNAPKHAVAPSPVWPPPLEISGKEWKSVLAEPPFVAPPKFAEPSEADKRLLNYWMMSKRATTLSFILFSSGFCLAVYAILVVFSDICMLQIGVFRTFGTNALAAYVIHQVVEHSVRAFAPHDSPLWWALGSFAIFAEITYLFVRHLEKSGIYLRM
jgi:predicted acyltransferase